MHAPAVGSLYVKEKFHSRPDFFFFLTWQCLFRAVLDTTVVCLKGRNRKDELGDLGIHFAACPPRRKAERGEQGWRVRGEGSV